MEFIETFKNFFRDKNVAAITSSSKFAVNRLCKRIDFNKDNVIVEYGPGTGAYTKKILENLTPNSHLILIETNPNFVKILKKIDDPRLQVFHDDASHVQEILEKAGVKEADYVISGIPFSFLSEDLKNHILSLTSQILKKNGKFLVYQTSNHIKPPLQEHFDIIKREIEIRNLPPLFIFEVKQKEQ